MRIGVPKEIKVHEYRVGMTPASVREAVEHGHQVFVERDAAARQGLFDRDYERAGATVLASATEVFSSCDLIVKVKEPQPMECLMLRQGQTLFTYLHLAPDPEQAKALMASGVTAIAYETVTSARGGLPLLAPMSEVAGRMASRAGVACCSAASPAWRLPRSSCSAAAFPVSTPRAWGSGSRRRSPCSTSMLSVFTPSTSSLVPPSIPSSPRARRLRITCSMPISSSAPCWCRERRHPSSSPTSWSAR